MDNHKALVREYKSMALEIIQLANIIADDINVKVPGFLDLIESANQSQ